MVLQFQYRRCNVFSSCDSVRTGRSVRWPWHPTHQWKMAYSDWNPLPLMRTIFVVATTRHVAAWSLEGVRMFNATSLSRFGTKWLRIWCSMVGKASGGRIRRSEVGRVDHCPDRSERTKLTLFPWDDNREIFQILLFPVSQLAYSLERCYMLAFLSSNPEHYQACF